MRLLAILLAAAVIGGAGGWLFERRLYRPLRRLGGRLGVLAGEAGASVPLVSDAERVDSLAAGLDRVVGRLKRRLDESDADRRRLQEILESMSDGVLVADRDQRVELLNRAFRALFAAGDAQPEQTVLELARSPALVRFMDRLEEGGGISVERIDSEAGRALELHGRRLTGGRMVVVAHDLTEQLRLDETRRDLVANVSHELRTPLTAIRGYAENLRDGALEDPATGARFVDRILAQSSRLEALLEDLLALSRLERQEEKPAPGEVVDLAALTEQAVETVRALAAEREVRLHLEAEKLPALAGSSEALERLLLNLLENAIKYNREGGTVTVDLRRRQGEIFVEVADTGIGIPQRDLPRIFERFYRVDSGRSREEGGTGLGLAIVKHAAQLHGGRVEVESELGRGSTFRVVLPLPSG